MPFTMPNSITAGTPVAATPIEANFDAIEAALNNIGSEALASNSVGTDQLAVDAVESENIKADAVTSEKLSSVAGAEAVTTDVIRDDAVTIAKREQIGKVSFTGGLTLNTSDTQLNDDEYSAETSEYTSVNGETIMLRVQAECETGAKTHETRRLKFHGEYAEAVKVGETWNAYGNWQQAANKVVAVPGYSDIYRDDQTIFIKTTAGNKYKFRAYLGVVCDSETGVGNGLSSHDISVADIVVIG